jgi:hypothetical protein
MGKGWGVSERKGKGKRKKGKRGERKKGKRGDPLAERERERGNERREVGQEREKLVRAGLQ